MKNPIAVELRKYLNGRSNYIAKLGQVESQGATREKAAENLLKNIDAMSVKTLAVRGLNDGRIAVLQCMGTDDTGAAQYYLQRYNASGSSGGGVLFTANHWNEAATRFENELRLCGQI